MDQAVTEIIISGFELNSGHYDTLLPVEDKMSVHISNLC
jgi:hypothetical protein